MGIIPTIFTTLAIGVSVLSAAGATIGRAILDSTLWVPGSQIITGNTFIVPDSNTTTTPGVYLNDEATPIQTYASAPGTESCIGNTGALLCTLTIKLTGSGGHRNNNAGSFVCGTATCSILDARVFTEAIPVANERLYGGWTTAPGTASGAQIFNDYAAASGATVIGSGAYVSIGDNALNVEKDVPPGATFKFVWRFGNSTEDYSSYKAAAVLRYWKYYNP